MSTQNIPGPLLQAGRLAIAVTAAMGVTYVACAALVALAPQTTLRLFGWMVHLVNVDAFVETALTPGAFLAGLLQVLLYAFVLMWIAGATYDRLGVIPARRTKARAGRRAA